MNEGLCRARASCYRTVTQRTEVVFADLVLLSAVFTHTAHPGLVVLDRLTRRNAHGKLPFHPRRGKQTTNIFSEMKTTVKAQLEQHERTLLEAGGCPAYGGPQEYVC